MDTTYRGDQMYEFELHSVHSTIPCYVINDNESNRYAVRTFDTSGAVFDSTHALLQWVKQEWKAEDFIDKQAFQTMLSELTSSLTESNTNHLL